MAPAADIWLVDHALSFAEIDDAVVAMRSHPSLLHRIADILELPRQEAAPPHEAEAAAAAAAAAATDSTQPGRAADRDGVLAADDGVGAISADVAEDQGSGAAGDALLQQVLGHLHEIVYEVVFRESADAQLSSGKHRQAHLGRASFDGGPCISTLIGLLYYMWLHCCDPRYVMADVNDGRADVLASHGWSSAAIGSFGGRYIMDELGSRIRAAASGQPPGFQLAPFAWRHADGPVELLSLLWAVRDVAAGEEVTCAGRLGMPDYSSRKYWCPPDMQLLLTKTRLQRRFASIPTSNMQRHWAVSEAMAMAVVGGTCVAERPSLCTGTTASGWSPPTSGTATCVSWSRCCGSTCRRRRRALPREGCWCPAAATASSVRSWPLPASVTSHALTTWPVSLTTWSGCTGE